MNIVVHFNNTTTEIQVASASSLPNNINVETWGQLCQRFCETKLLHPPQLLQLLTALHPDGRMSHYQLRYGDGYATIVRPTWSEHGGLNASVDVVEEGDDAGSRMVEANVTLKPRGDGGPFSEVQNLPQVEVTAPFNGGSNKAARPEMIDVDLYIERVGDDGAAGVLPFPMTQTPFPTDDSKTNVLFVKEHSQFKGAVDNFSIERASGQIDRGCMDKFLIERAAGYDRNISASMSSKKRKENPTDATPTKEDKSNKKRKTSKKSAVKSSKDNGKKKNNEPIEEEEEETNAAVGNDEVIDGDDDEKVDAMEDKPKRPLNAYMTFSNEVRAKIKEDNPDAKPTEIMSKVGEAYRALGDDAKKQYKDVAGAAMAKFKEEHGDDALKRKSKKKKKQTNSGDVVVKRQSSGGGGGSHPTGDNLAHIPAEPAAGFPEGWTTQSVPRKTGDKSDMYWFSPAKSFKFRSKPQVKRFRESLERAGGGDEVAAMELYLREEKEKSGGNNGSSKKRKAISGKKKKGDDSGSVNDDGNNSSDGDEVPEAWEA